MRDAQSLGSTVVASWEAPDWGGFEWTGWVPLTHVAVRDSKHVLHELESDLLGWHYSTEKSPPAMQYMRMPRAVSVRVVAP